MTNICGLIFSVWGVDKNFAQLEERDKLLKCWRRLQYPAQREQWTPNILQNFSLDDSIKQKSRKPRTPIIFFLFDTVHYVHFVKYDDAVSFYDAVSDTKMAIILPTGQWYAPSAVINVPWYCMVLHGIAWYIAWYCIVLHGIT